MKTLAKYVRQNVAIFASCNTAQKNDLALARKLAGEFFCVPSKGLLVARLTRINRNLCEGSNLFPADQVIWPHEPPTCGNHQCFVEISHSPAEVRSVGEFTAKIESAEENTSPSFAPWGLRR